MTPDAVNQFFSFLYTGTLGNIVSWLQVISAFLTVVGIATYVAIIFEYRMLIGGKRRKREPKIVDEVSEAPVVWKEIQQKLDSQNPSDWNIAVTRADALFDSILKETGVEGANFGERLKSLDRSKLNSLDDVWEAHKIRNRIVHQTDAVLTQGEAKHAVGLFAKGLRELEYLQDE